MRAKDLLSKPFVYINQYNNNGSLEGYVVNTDKENLGNYLYSQGADKRLIQNIINRYNRVAVIRNLQVDELSRNRGIGTELLNKAITDAIENNAELAILVADSAEQNDIDLVKWYKSFGFNIVGSAGGDPIMVLKL